LAARLGDVSATVLAVTGYAVLMVLLAVPSKPLVVVVVVVSGLVSGLLNTLFTGTAMSVSPAPRPVASAGYNFCRWLGGALAATLVGHVADWLGSAHAPFIVAAVCCLVAAALLAVRRPRRPESHRVPAEAVLVGEEF
jgi:fucose permease